MRALWPSELCLPFEHQSPPICENCIQVKQLIVWSTAPWSRALLQAYTSDHPADQIKDWQQSWQIAPTSEVTCRACGCSDNTIGQWTRWCPVPLIVALSILCPTCGLITLVSSQEWESNMRLPVPWSSLQFLRTNLGGIQPTTGIIGWRKVLYCQWCSNVARGQGKAANSSHMASVVPLKASSKL